MSLQQNPEALDAIAFAERVLTLLDEGAYNTTYKFSVLLGLMDLVIEKSAGDGSLVTMLTTKQLALFLTMKMSLLLMLLSMDLEMHQLLQFLQTTTISEKFILDVMIQFQ